MTLFYKYVYAKFLEIICTTYFKIIFLYVSLYVHTI